MQRQKLPQELMMQRLKFLIPNAVMSVRPYDNNEHLVHNPVIRGDMLIDWHPENGECPSLEEIMKVSLEQIDESEKTEIKLARNIEKANDLTLVALYDLEKKNNPELKFEEYLDQLENISQALKLSNKIK